MFDSSVNPTTESPSSSSLSILVLACSMATGATVSNLLLLLAIYRDPYRNLRTASSSLVTNLALCDFLVGFIAGYGLFVYHLCVYVRLHIPGYAIDGVLVLSSIAMVSGISTIVVMSIDRYLAVISPFKYAAKITARRIHVVLLSVWTYAILINLLMFLILPRRLGTFISTHLHISLPAGVLCTAYVKMIREVQRQNKRWQKGRNRFGFTTTVSTTLSAGSERERKLTSAILLIVASFGLCFLPLYVAVNVRYLKRESKLIPWCYTLLEVSLLVVISNSLFNPLIYALRVPKYRKAVRNILGLRNNIVNVLISALGPINTQGRGS